MIIIWYVYYLISINQPLPFTNPHHHGGLPHIKVSQATQDLNDDGLRFLWLLIDVSTHHDFFTKPAWKILVAGFKQGSLFFVCHNLQLSIGKMVGKPLGMVPYIIIVGIFWIDSLFKGLQPGG